MPRIPESSRRTTAASTAAAAVAAAVTGVVQVVHEPSGQSTVVGAIEHLALAGFSAFFLLLVPAVLHLGRRAGRAWPATLAVTGQTALAALATVSNVRGEDPAFFPAVAVASNAAILIGWAALAVLLARGGRLSVPLAVGIPLSLPFFLTLSPFGGALVVAAFWAAMAWMIRHDRLPVRMPRAEVRPA